MTRIAWSILVLGSLSVALAGCRQDTVEIPERSMIVKHGSSDPKHIIALFRHATQLPASDTRLAVGDLLPYWPWDFQVVREMNRSKYTITLSIMGSPEEGLKYRDKLEAGWHRRELEEWSGKMLD